MRECVLPVALPVTEDLYEGGGGGGKNALSGAHIHPSRRDRVSQTLLSVGFS